MAARTRALPSSSQPRYVRLGALAPTDFSVCLSLAHVLLRSQWEPGQVGKGRVIRTGVTFGQVGFQSRATFPATPNSQPPPTNINFNFNVSFGDRWISNGHMAVRFSGRWIKIF